MRHAGPIIVIWLFLTSVSSAATTSPATTQSADATLQVYSLRLARNAAGAQDMQRRFGGRFFNDGSGAGITMQLILTLRDGTFLPLPRDPVALDTFVDDTYENLLIGPVENRAFSQPPALSSDATQVLFQVMSAKPPADEAGRAFVRGTFQARLARGSEQTAKATLKLKPGEQVEVGPFCATIRSISQSDQSMSLFVDVPGADALRIRQMRLLDKDGKRLNRNPPGNYEERNEPVGAPREHAATSFNASIPAGIDQVEIEFAYAERVENVRIPVQAQIDFGLVKVGPIRSMQRPGGVAGGRGGVREGDWPPGRVEDFGSRVWPPPPLQPQATASMELWPTRVPFDPSTQAASRPGTQNRIERATVDLFALTVAKPPPDDAQQKATTTWSNPPDRAFAASGYTHARLLLSVPDGSIASVAADAIAVDRFEDDKAGLDPTIFRDTLNRSGERAIVSPDGRQALVDVTLATAPTPGATRVTLTGSIKAKVAIRESNDESPPVAFMKGEQAKAGPVTVQFLNVALESAVTPGPQAGRPPYNCTFAIDGPINMVRSIEIVNADTGRRLISRNLFGSFNENRHMAGGGGVQTNATFTETPPEKVIVRVRRFEKLDIATVPFEVTTGIGL